MFYLKEMKIENSFYPKSFVKKYSSLSSYVSKPVPFIKVHNPHFKNVLCKYFVHKKCTRGTDCLFSHDLNQFRESQIIDAIEEYEKSSNLAFSHQSEEENDTKFISPLIK